MMHPQLLFLLKIETVNCLMLKSDIFIEGSVLPLNITVKDELGDLKTV